MKKKYADNSDEENEFDVDEPEEIQNNASDDDWTPSNDNSRGRRTSTRLRNIPRSRAPIIDASSTDEEESDESQGTKRKGGKGRGRGRPPVKKHKVSSTTTPRPSVKSENSGSKSISSDSEPSSTTTSTNNATPTVIKINKDFTSGAFVILKSDAENLDEDPPLWKIDGKALLQKYVPFEQDGKKLYKNTSVYSGWTLSNKDNFYPVSVIFKQQTRKEHIIEFNRDQIKQNNTCSEVTSSQNEEVKPAVSVPLQHNEASNDSTEKPIIKVKSFAVIPDENSTNSLIKPFVERNSSPSLTATTVKINKDFISGAFLVLRNEASNVDPPLWKIDGKALLQKYNPFQQKGKTLYRNTAEYSGWTYNNRFDYFPVSVAYKQQNRKEHIVELIRIKWDEPDDSSNED